MFKKTVFAFAFILLLATPAMTQDEPSPTPICNPYGDPWPPSGCEVNHLGEPYCPISLEEMGWFDGSGIWHWRDYQEGTPCFFGDGYSYTSGDNRTYEPAGGRNIAGTWRIHEWGRYSSISGFPDNCTPVDFEEVFTPYRNTEVGHFVLQHRRYENGKTFTNVTWTLNESIKYPNCIWTMNAGVCRPVGDPERIDPNHSYVAWGINCNWLNPDPPCEVEMIEAEKQPITLDDIESVAVIEQDTDRIVASATSSDLFLFTGEILVVNYEQNYDRPWYNYWQQQDQTFRPDNHPEISFRDHEFVPKPYTTYRLEISLKDGRTIQALHKTGDMIPDLPIIQTRKRIRNLQPGQGQGSKPWTTKKTVFIREDSDGRMIIPWGAPIVKMPDTSVVLYIWSEMNGFGPGEIRQNQSGKYVFLRQPTHMGMAILSPDVVSAMKAVNPEMCWIQFQVRTNTNNNRAYSNMIAYRFQ